MRDNPKTINRSGVKVFIFIMLYTNNENYNPLLYGYNIYDVILSNRRRRVLSLSQHTQYLIY